jgi:putative transposase
MARFEVPAGWTAQAYRFALDPTAGQAETLGSHAGGARFAYNVMLAAVGANLDQRAAERSYGIGEADLTPWLGWSFQALRNDFNRRKHTVAVRADGTPWWAENSKEVYANACRALAEALSNWGASRGGTRSGPRMGFPRFKTKTGAVKKFSFTTGAIRVEPDRNHITLPRLGTIKTHESTRKLARRISAGSARILKATVRFERGRWQVSLNCLVQRDWGRPAHVKPGAAVVGIDAGVKDLIVVADPGGNELARHRAPRELKAAHRKLRGVATQGGPPGRSLGQGDGYQAGTVTRLDAHPGRHRARACTGGSPARGPAPQTHGPAQPNPRGDRRGDAGREEHDGPRRGS